MESDFKILDPVVVATQLLNTGHIKILIDAGFSGKQINRLNSIGESIDTLDGIFLTHEHSDHSQGIRGISKRYDLYILKSRHCRRYSG